MDNGNDTIRLIDVTEENWESICELRLGHEGEEFDYSNAFSIVQSFYEKTLVKKGITHNGKLIGFTLYGYCHKRQIYELCSFMIDYHFRGKGYGRLALTVILDEIKRTLGCDKIYLSTNPKNLRAIHIYESFGFVATDDVWEETDGERVYCLDLSVWNSATM